MNHAQSMETKAAERYLLGELPPQERDAFEQHYFACPDCAGDVCAGTVLIHGMKAYFDGARVAPRRTRLPVSWPWHFGTGVQAGVPAAAAFALLALAVYQNAVLFPGLRREAAELAAPRALASAVLVPAARSTPPMISVPASARFFQLTLELPPARATGTYDCELRDSAGRSLWKMPVRASSAEEISLLIPAAKLEDGAYELGVRGADGRDPIAVSPFRFRLSRHFTDAAAQRVYNWKGPQ